MESDAIWIFTVILIVSISAPYFIKFRKRQKMDIERRKEAEILGISKPSSQYPMIDSTLCIGCRTCVDACPEHDVLGIVFGKAMVINGQRCVGHGYCELVCPVGALKVGLGDIKTRPDIPVVDDNNQSNIPGLFIAGELAGLSLIRNAIDQGRRVIEKIAENNNRSANENIYDVIIIGAGPAGLTASLNAIKNKLSYLLIDQQAPGGTILQYPRHKLVMTQPVEIPLYGWLKKEEYAKEDLLDIWNKILNDFKINVRVGEKIESVRKEAEVFKVKSLAAEYSANHVVLSMGRRGTPRKLGVTGEDLPKTLYQLLDAQSYNNNHILVVGGGDSAIEAAVGLAHQTGNKITISYRKSTFARVKKKNEDLVKKAIAEKKVRAIFNSEVLEIRDKNVKLKVGEDIVEILNDFVFVFIGGEPPIKMLKEMGILFGGEAPVIEVPPVPAMS